MFAPVVAVMASAWLVSAKEHPHAAFAFIRTGERTPNLRPGSQVLTALGADQMYTLGQNFRSRYITSESPRGFGVDHIAGLSPDILNNEQILVQTLDTQYLVSSAQAFMQGLYPPHSVSNGTDDASGLLANGSSIDYPLNGYQYANIQTSGPLDPGSIFISGTQNCPVAQREALNYFVSDQYLETKAANQEFYQSLDVDWFEGNLKEDQLDYRYARQIAEYLTYQYAHNSTIYKTLSNGTDVYNKTRYMADEVAWYRYGNASSDSTDGASRAIAGQTLAAAILSQFQNLIANRTSGRNTAGNAYPLTFLFGEEQPMISLISLMMNDDRDDFHSIPPFGSAIIFELFSSGDSADFPSDEDDLWVRFYFHNGTVYGDGQLRAFSFPSDSPSQTDMPWHEFQTKFTQIGIRTLTEWCTTCASPSLFCWGVDGTDISFTLPARERKNKIMPAVAGVIGAVITLVVAGILFAMTMLLGGIRFHRVQRTTTNNNKKSELGGFKGSAKLASDPDLSLAKNGASPTAGIVSFGAGERKPHERVGSWELRQKEFGKGGGDLGDLSPRGSFDGIDAVAGRPVEPHHHV